MKIKEIIFILIIMNGSFGRKARKFKRSRRLGKKIYDPNDYEKGLDEENMTKKMINDESIKSKRIEYK